MKRFSKILAVLLTVGVIAGLIAVFASADDTNRGYTEYVENFDKLGNKDVVEVGGEAVNRYLKLTSSQTTALFSLSEDEDEKTAADKALTNGYAAVTQILLSAENGMFVPGAKIVITDAMGSNTTTMTISKQTVEKVDKYYITVSGGDEAMDPVELNTNGDWNVITIAQIRNRGVVQNANNAGQKASVYVNGTYAGYKGQSGDGLRGVLYNLTVTIPDTIGEGENLVFDKAVARVYCSKVTDGIPSYAIDPSVGTVGMDGYAVKGDITGRQDVYYNKYSTTAAYPITVNGGTQTPEIAYYDADGNLTMDYMDLGRGLAAINEHAVEGGTIKFYKDATLPALAVKKVTVEALNGAKVNLDAFVTAGFEKTETAIDGGTRYVLALPVVATIGETDYYNIATALSALGNGQTIVIKKGSAISGVALGSFCVEAANGVDITFESSVVSAYKILSGERDGVKIYSLTKKSAASCNEFTNDFNAEPVPGGADSNVWRTWCNNLQNKQDGKRGSLVTLTNGNSYWRMYPVNQAGITDLNSDGTQKSGNGNTSFNLVLNAKGVVTGGYDDIWSEYDYYNYGYVVTEYLFMAEPIVDPETNEIVGPGYIDKMSMSLVTDYDQPNAKENGNNISGKPQSTSISDVFIIKSAADGKWYAGANTTTPAVALSEVYGEWNVVTVVSKITNADAAAHTADVTTYTFVNGEHIVTDTKTQIVMGAYTDILMKGSANTAAISGQNICLDGASIRFYNTDYTSGADYGIDDYFADVKNGVATSPLYCKDTLYNGETANFPGAEGATNKYAPKASVNGNNFFFVEGAFMNLSEGDTLGLYVDYAFDTVPIVPFNVAAYNNAKITFAESIHEEYIVTVTEEGDTTYYNVKREPKASIGEGENYKEYFNMNKALADLTDGGTLNVYVDYTIPELALDGFTVVAHNDARVTFVSGYYDIEQSGNTYTVAKRRLASVGGTSYDTIEEAIAALKALGEKGVLTINANTTISNIDLDEFTVVARNGANVVFGKLFVGKYDVVKSEAGDGTVYYAFTIRDFFEITDDVNEGSYSTGTTVTVEDENGNILNKYQKLTSNGALDFLSNYAESLPSLTPGGKYDSARYIVTQFLFAAEDGNYPDGATIQPIRTSSNRADSNIGSILIKKGADEKYYADFRDPSGGAVTVKDIPLTANGDWNVVTVVMDRRSTTATSTTGGVLGYIFVNGQLLGGRNPGSATNHSALTTLSVANVSNGNLIFDGFNARYYLSGQNDAGHDIYDGGNGVTIDDIFKSTWILSSATIQTLPAFEDIFYNKNSTVEDFPVSNYNDTIHTQTATYVGGVGYVDTDTAISKLIDGGEITFEKDATLPALPFEKITVIKSGEKVNVNIDAYRNDQYTIDETTVDGVTTYVIEKKALASIGNDKYYDLGEAFAALTEGGKIQLHVSATLPALSLNYFEIEYVENVNVELGEANKLYSMVRDGDVYKVTKLPFAQIGENKYNTVEEALAALKDGERLIFNADVTISAILKLDEFIVEAGNGATVTFADQVTLRFNIQKSANVYGLTRKTIVELSSDFSDVSTDKQITAGGAFTTNKDNTPVTADTALSNAIVTSGTDKYLQLYANSAATNSLTLDFFKSMADAPKMRDYAYSTYQFLLGAEGGEYIDGLFIKPTSHVDYASNFWGIKICKDEGGYYACWVENATKSFNPEGSYKKAYLNTEDGKWNVVTIVVVPSYREDCDYELGGNQVAQSFFFVNDTYIGGRNQTGSNFAGTNLGFLGRLQLTTSVAEGTGNVLLGGYNARYYLSDFDYLEENDNLGKYETPGDFYGIDDLVGTRYQKGDPQGNVTKCEDLLYNKYDTTSEYPAIRVGEQFVSMPAEALVGSTGYVTVDGAISKAQNENTITLNKGYTLSEILEGIEKLTFAGTGTLILTGEAAERYEYINGVLTVAKLYTAEFIIGKGYDNVILDPVKSSMAPDPSNVSLEGLGVKGTAPTTIDWQFSLDDGTTWTSLNEWDGNVEDGATVLVKPTQNIIVEVTWKVVGGDVVEKYFVGSEIERNEAIKPSSETTPNPNSNWYRWGYDWDLEAGRLVDADESNNVIEQKQVPVADVDVKFSYTLGTRFGTTFYIPQAEAGITMTDLRWHKNFTTSYGAVENWSDKLVLVNLGAGVGNFYKFDAAAYDTTMGLAPGFNKTDIHMMRVQALKISYTVVVEGKTYVLEDEFKVSFACAEGEEQEGVVYYANMIFANASTEECDSGVKLVAEFVKLIKTANPSFETTADQLLNKIPTHGEGCTCKGEALESAIPNGHTIDPSEFNDLTENGDDVKISFRTDGDAAGFAVYVNSKYTSVTVSVLPIGTTEMPGIVNNKYVNETTAFEAYIVLKTEGDFTIYAPEHGTGYTTSAIYNYACNTKFVVECMDGETPATFEFTYSLADIIYDNAGTANENTQVFDITCAYLNFAKAAYNYKTGR